MKGTCSICGRVVRSHASKKRTGRQNFLIAMRKHQWGNHRNTMISRIKAGKAENLDNPVLQDFLKNLQTNFAAAYREHVRRTKRARKYTYRMMTLIRPYLLPEMQIQWDLFQALVGEDGGIIYTFTPEFKQ